jgi:hypothetical protein
MKVTNTTRRDAFTRLGRRAPVSQRSIAKPGWLARHTSLVGHRNDLLC